MRHTPPKPLCWLLVFLLMFEWGGVIGWLPSGQAAQPVSLALPSGAELTKAGTLTLQIAPRAPVKPDALVARTEAVVRSVPGVRYDLATRAEALGSGLDPAFRFVRDQIRFEAYSGVLRGAEGAYLTRAGNASDRSLLLADLLKRKGVKTRFAMGKLPRPQAERVYARIFEPARPLEVDAVTKAASFGQAEAEAFMVRLRARAVRDYAAIRKALGNALPSKASPSRDEVLREIEAHVWVQAEQNGRWVDLDTVFSDATPGRTYAAAERTVEALPKGSYQRVTIRVTSETFSGNSLKTETALEFSSTAEEVLDRQIFVAHAPGGGGGGLEGAISGAVAGADAWTPMLWVDGQVHMGKPISFSEQAKPAERGRPPGGGLGGLFGAGGALASSSQFVAEWLEFEITFPDGRRDVTRRALIDRAGMAWRQGGKLDPAGLRPLSRDTQGITGPRALHNIWFSAGRHNLGEYAAALQLFAHWMARSSLKKAQSAGTSASPKNPTFGEMVWPFALMNFAFLVQSDHAVIPALNDSPSVRLYGDSPRIILMSVGPEPRAGGSAKAYMESDLRRDVLRGLAREASAEVGVVERKIWFGVLEGALEHEIGVAWGGDASALVSASGLLTAEGVAVLRPGDAAHLGKLVAKKETAAHAARALVDGNTLVVPKPVLGGGVLAWWEIAGDGTTRAVLKGETGGTWRPWPDIDIDPPNVDYPVPKPGDGPGGTTPVDPLPGGGHRPPATGPEGPIPRDPLPGPEPAPGGARPPGSPPTTGPATAKPGPGGWDPSKYPQHNNPMSPGGTKDDCKKGSSLPTQRIRVAMASSLPSGLLDGQSGESVRPPLLLAQTATESTLVTKCVAVPAVGVAGIAMAIVALGFLGVAAAALGYLIGSNL